MKPSELYLVGAEQCAGLTDLRRTPFRMSECDFSYACDSIRGWACSDEALKEFAEYFGPKRGNLFSWFGSVTGVAGAHNSHYRVLALCFMAAIAKSEGR